MAAIEEHVPAPADTPEHTADELLAEVADRGGRVFRMTEGPGVFVLTMEEELAAWLTRLGGKTWVPMHLAPEQLGPARAYRRTKNGPWEWDLYIHTIPVAGERTIWEAAREFEHGLKIP